ncbi:MAG: hypothetical protein DSY89_02385 [Deltaproteobacteria bacterium]|nr:MAG: hypothetical protein DSY89_02385 [Deltaproteobacteria bacterium]
MRYLSYIGLIFFIMTGCAGRSDLTAPRSYPEVDSALSGCVDGRYPCGRATPFDTLVEKTIPRPDQGQRHFVNLLEHGDDALVVRLHLIRSARRSIDFQTFIWGSDDVSDLFFKELVLAARRGVRVRILVDQLTGNRQGKWLTYGAFVHQNLQIKLYNPTFHKGKNTPLDLMAAFLFYYHTFNQRMHNKVFIVDAGVGITGGRNIERKYFDLDPEFTFKDRDVLVVGPVVADMEQSFIEYWKDKRSVALRQLNNTDPQRTGIPVVSPKWLPTDSPLEPMLAALDQRASDQRYIKDVFVDTALPVSGDVRFFSDPPGKKPRRSKKAPFSCASGLHRIIFGAEHSLVMQTPYLLFSRKALRGFKKMRKKNPALEIIASTNSLATTDSLSVYAIAFKEKKKLVKNLKFTICELKSVPGDVRSMVRNYDRLREKIDRHLENQDLYALGIDIQPQIGLHGKSFVVDDKVAWIGSHNFDPRSDHYNTEVGLAIWDKTVAARLKENILRDVAPQNSYLIARQPQVPVISYFSGLVGSLFRALPFLDIWPFRYTTSYELRPGKKPVPRDHPLFQEHYKNMGAFPGINLSIRAMQVRLLTVMGGFLAPIL